MKLNEKQKQVAETRKINQAFAARQKELEKYISADELAEEKIYNRIEEINNKMFNSGTITQKEADFLNENSYLPKNFKYTTKGLLSHKEIENIKVQPKIKNNMSKNYRTTSTDKKGRKVTRVSAKSPFIEKGQKIRRRAMQLMEAAGKRTVTKTIYKMRLPDAMKKAAKELK
ncbi:MAG TPA: hypothetical protein DCQ31_07965 [Bacteroidales bacterium]|nr:hypothetical protein [Bacteroidales bacterium]